MLTTLPACVLHPGAPGCKVVLLSNAGNGVIEGRAYDIEDFHKWRLGRPHYVAVSSQVNMINAAADCTHTFDEDCLICANCGRCSESLNDQDLCEDCA